MDANSECHYNGSEIVVRLRGYTGAVTSIYVNTIIKHHAQYSYCCICGGSDGTTHGVYASNVRRETFYAICMVCVTQFELVQKVCLQPTWVSRAVGPIKYVLMDNHAQHEANSVRYRLVLLFDYPRDICGIIARLIVEN